MRNYLIGQCKTLKQCLRKDCHYHFMYIKEISLIRFLLDFSSIEYSFASYLYY